MSDIYNLIKKDMKKKLYLLLLLFTTSLCFISCGYSKGERVVIRNRCLACDTKEELRQSVKYANEKNSLGFASMVGSLSTTILEKGYHATVVEVADDGVQIEIYKGRKVWVLERNIKSDKR